MTKRTTAWAAAALLAMTGMASAGIITSAPGGGAVVDFNQFGPGFTHTAGSVNVGGSIGQTILFTSTTSGSVLGSGHYGLGDIFSPNNGNWEESKTGFAGLNTDGDGAYMQFMFTGPLSSVGGFVNYVPEDGAAVLSVLGVGGNVLESYDLTSVAAVSTYNLTDSGAFRGISRAAGDIYGLRLSGAYFVIDDMKFVTAGATAVPLPSAAWMGLATLGGIGFLALRRKRRLAEAAL